MNAVEFFAWYCACGLLIARAGLVPKAAFELPGADRAWRWSQLACLALLLVTGIALLIVRTAKMSALPLAQAIGIVPEVFLQTHFGAVWGVHLVLLVLLGASVLLPRRLGIPASVCLAALVAFTYSAASHASDRGDLTLSELNDWVHVIATSLWGGGILAVLFFAFPLLRGRRALLVTTVIRLSGLSGVALVGAAVTGIGNGFLRLRDLDDLMATGYGRTLALKVALVGMMALLGAYGRFSVVSRLRGALGDSDADVCLRRVARALAADTVLIALVLLAAAMLIQAMPPSSMHGMGKMAM